MSPDNVWWAGFVLYGTDSSKGPTGVLDKPQSLSFVFTIIGDTLETEGK